MGFPVLGGHSITDPEPKYGMVVLGFVDPRRMLRNSTAVAGDTLVLTKPLGLGVISTAVKRGVATDEMLATAVDLMTTPNRAACEAVHEVGADAATDVTGFGLLGHLHRMLLASGVAAEIDASAVPLIDGALDLARSGVVPGGTAAQPRLRLAPRGLGGPRQSPSSSCSPMPRRAEDCSSRRASPTRSSRRCRFAA